MSTIDSTNVNTFESTVAGITVRSRAHSLSVWFVLALRLTIGYAFLYSGVDKVLSGDFDAYGYLTGGVPANGSPVADLYVWMGQTDWFLAFVDFAVPWGELLIGLALIVGLFTRLAAFWGAVMMLLFYFGNWSVEHGHVNSDFAYMLVFLAVAAFGAGRILGLDAYVEKIEVGGEPLVEKYPIAGYLLG